MSFVHPHFLWLLGFLALPILIHLFHFRRYKILYFSSLKFVKQIEQEKKSARKLKEWIILALRLLAFTALILAFAQPYLDSNPNSKQNGIPFTAIYIDNSLSMSARGLEGELLSEARETARRIIEQSPSTSRILLCTNGLSDSERKLHTKSTAIQALDQIEFATLSRPLNQVLSWQNDFLNRYNDEIARIGSVQRLVLSDFQKSSFDLTDFKSRKDEVIHAVQFVPQKKGNLFIDSIWMDSPVHRAGQSVQIFFRLVNESTEPQQDVEITVNMGQQKRMTNLNVNARGKSEGFLYFTPSKNGYNEGQIHLQDQSILWDDEFYFTSFVSNSGNILIVNGENAGNQVANVLGVEPFYETKICKEFDVNPRILSAADMVILNGVNDLPGGMAAYLDEYLNQGGSLFIIPGADISFAAYDQFLRPYSFPKLSEGFSAGSELNKIDYKNTFFKGMFDIEKQKLNLPIVSKYYAATKVNQSNVSSLLSLRNNLPLFLRGGNKGQIFLLTTPLGNEMGSFSNSALFPSLILRAAEISLKALPSYQIIGSPQSFYIKNTGSEDAPISLQNGKLNFIPRQITNEGISTIQLNNPEALKQLKEGIYQLKSDENLGLMALNLNREESRIATLTAKELEMAFSEAGVSNVKFSTVSEGAETINIELFKPSSYWRIFVCLSFLFLILEMAILKFMK